MESLSMGRMEVGEGGRGGSAAYQIRGDQSLIPIKAPIYWLRDLSVTSACDNYGAYTSNWARIWCQWIFYWFGIPDRYRIRNSAHIDNGNNKFHAYDISNYNIGLGAHY